MEESRATADDQRAIIGIHDRQTASSVGEQIDSLSSDLEKPRLRVVPRGCENGIIQNKTKFVEDVCFLRIVSLGNAPRVESKRCHRGYLFSLRIPAKAPRLRPCRGRKGRT